MAELHLEYKPNFTKARLLAPFSPLYRFRRDLGRYPEHLRIIAFEVLATDDHRIALVKNSKAGCTTASHLLFQYSKGYACEKDVHRPDIGLLQGTKHYQEALGVLTSPGAIKVTTVRHPIARAVSAFADFFIDQRNHLAARHRDAIRHFGFHEDRSETENFDAFLDLVEFSFSVSREYTDRHFRPQTINTAFGKVDYDHICRVETLARDMEGVLRHAGLPEDRISQIQATAHNRSPRPPYAPNARQTDRLAALYEDDFRNFGYDPKTR